MYCTFNLIIDTCCVFHLIKWWEVGSALDKLPRKLG